MSAILKVVKKLPLFLKVGSFDSELSTVGWFL